MTHPPWKPIATGPDDGTMVLVGWAGSNSTMSAWFAKGKWRGITPLCNQPDFWRELPPGPGDEPENAKLIEACETAKAFLERLTAPGPPVGLAGLEHAVEKLQAAIDAEESHV